MSVNIIKTSKVMMTSKFSMSRSVLSYSYYYSIYSSQLSYEEGILHKVYKAQKV